MFEDECNGPPEYVIREIPKRQMKPSVPAVRCRIRELYAARGEYCCCFSVLENGKEGSWWLDDGLQTARERGHVDCEEVLGLMRLMSNTQRKQPLTP